MLFKSFGTLRYSTNWLKMDIDQGIQDFYFNMFPKFMDVNRQKFSAHVTVVRGEYESELDRTNWKNHNGEVVEFFYDNYVCEGKVYFWLNVYSVRLEEIREELGLSRIDSYRDNLPENFTYTFHTTIGNKK